ncbi:MAG: hypothetical protein Kow0037_30110 [Calditrichia bacterium]
MVDHVVGLAQQISDDAFLVCGNAPCPPDVAIPRHPDLIPNCGPIGGIYTALNISKYPLVAVIPGDVPLLPITVYQILYRFSDGKRPVAALSHQGLEPLVSIWPVRLRDVLKNSIEEGMLGLRHQSEKLLIREVEIAAYAPNYREEWFFNVNTPEDLEKLKALLMKH